MFEVNDLVQLNNENSNIVFKIININDSEVILKGYIYRIQIKSNLNDLKLASQIDVEKENELLNKSFRRTIKVRNKINSKVIFGTILHIDSDKEFLKNCMDLYKEMKIHAWGVLLKESNIKKYIKKILTEINPDIIVLTGHDYYNGKDITNINNYENSTNYIDTVKLIRQIYDKDAVTIIAGACCSHFEALIANGANFASSPKRIHVHTYDPAIIAIKCATTSYNQTIDFNNVMKYIENGKDAYGGIETKGKMRILL